MSTVEVDAIPRGRAQTLAGATHATYATRPDQFEQAVRDFAASL